MTKVEITQEEWDEVSKSFPIVQKFVVGTKWDTDDAIAQPYKLTENICEWWLFNEITKEQCYVFVGRHTGKCEFR